MNVVVAMDGSTASWEAIRWLESWRDLNNHSLHLIGVIPPWAPSWAPAANGWLPPSTAEHWLEESRQATQNSLNAAAAHLSACGFEVVAHMRQGEALTAITNLARDLPADLIVVGRSPASRWLRWLTGSVSTALLGCWPGALILVPASRGAPRPLTPSPARKNI